MSDVNRMDRSELQSYLEGRGFAVYDSEATTTLREAVRLDMKTGRKEGQRRLAKLEEGLDQEEKQKLRHMSAFAALAGGKR